MVVEEERSTGKEIEAEGAGTWRNLSTGKGMGRRKKWGVREGN